MRSFQFLDQSEVRDTKIPAEAIPLIILHWNDEYYYGGYFSPLEMRKYLEKGLRDKHFTRSAVQVWLVKAKKWAMDKEMQSAGSVEALMAEYHKEERKSAWMEQVVA